MQILYTVRPGDTLYEIARSWELPLDSIIAVNNLAPPYTIYVGQQLSIPPGVDVFRVKPGDQGLIAYTSNRGRGYDIWVLNPRDGGNIQLTTGLGASFSIPFWSPDSRWIAFVGRKGILYIFHVSERRYALIDQFLEGEGIFLNWSPNSQKLVYSKQDQIIIYHVLTHQAERINQPDATDVQWFPSGTELLFQAPDGAGISQLFRMKTDGSNKVQITRNTGGRFNFVRLSPDGLYVLYSTPGASISIIYTIELSTGKIAEVRGGPLAKNYFPVWSPNSSTIAYSATAFKEVGYFSLIRTSGRQGENDRTRAISSCFATPITWSPDGGKIAYLSGCNNEGVASEVWVLDVTHPLPIKVIDGARITSLQWSPLLVKNTFTNTEFRVRFNYPSQWRKVTDERYEGADGFFQIAAIYSEENIHTICLNEAFHQLLPYGTEPRIFPTQIQAQEACFIFPSADQPPEMKGQAALIVRYPSPVEVGGTTYNFFVLWADKNHIQEISSTLRFL